MELVSFTSLPTKQNNSINSLDFLEKNIINFRIDLSGAGTQKGISYHVGVLQMSSQQEKGLIGVRPGE